MLYLGMRHIRKGNKIMELKELLQKLNSGQLTFRMKALNGLNDTTTKAKVMYFTHKKKEYAILQSYNTFVSIYDFTNKAYFGRRYSATTSKHQNKFKVIVGVR